MIVFNLLPDSSSHPSLRSSRGNNSRLGGVSDRKVKINRVAKIEIWMVNAPWTGTVKRWNTLFWRTLVAKHGELPMLVHHGAEYVGGLGNNLICRWSPNRSITDRQVHMGERGSKGTPSQRWSAIIKSLGEIPKSKDDCGNAFSQPLLVPEECDKAYRHDWLQMVEC